MNVRVLFLVTLFTSICTSCVVENPDTAPADFIFVGTLDNHYVTSTVFDHPRDPHLQWKPYDSGTVAPTGTTVLSKIEVSNICGHERARLRVTRGILGTSSGAVVYVNTALDENCHSNFASDSKEWLIEATLFGDTYWQDDDIYPVYRDSAGLAIIFPLNNLVTDGDSLSTICGVDPRSMFSPVSADIPAPELMGAPKIRIDYLLERHLIRMEHGVIYHDQGVYVDSLAAEILRRSGMSESNCAAVKHWL